MKRRKSPPLCLCSRTVLAAIGAVALLLARVSPAMTADRIVLRDLTIIADKTVKSFDEDGVKLNDGSILTWDSIEKGTIAADQQAAFDELLKTLGGDLYRLRQRLSVGDNAGMSAPAEALYPRYQARTGDTAYMVCQATMWSRLAAGKREGALAPYLRCYAALRAAGDKPPPLPGARRLPLDMTTGLTDDLAPVWFDAEAAKAALPDALAAVRGLGSNRPPAAYIYYAALALAAGDDEKAMQSLQALKEPEGVIAELRDVLLAQRETLAGAAGEASAGLESRLPELNAQSRPLAYYWLGRLKSQSADAAARDDGVLCLMHAPALYRSQHPDVAAASLYASMQALAAGNDAAASAAIKNEILRNFGATHHAQLLQDASRK